MMSTAYPELDHLLAALCNGTISADETARLDSLLEMNHDARRFYNNYMFLHAELYSQHASLEAVDVSAKASIPTADIRNRKAFHWLTIAAALVGVAVGSSWLTYFMSRAGESRPTEIAESADTQNTTKVARISATRNCMWADTGKNLGF